MIKPDKLDVEIWVDLLCWESFMKILLFYKKPIKKIYYINSDKFFYLFIPILQIIIKKPMTQVDWIVEGDEKIGDTSLYELIRIKSKEILSEWVSQDEVFKKINDFCDKYKYNQTKFREHLKTEAYSHIFRPVEMLVISQKISGTNSSLFILRKTPFRDLLINILGKNKIYFYPTFISHRFKINNRIEYFYDPLFNKKYYSGKIGYIMQNFRFCVRASVNSVLFFFWNTILFFEPNKELANLNIGVELIRSRMRLDEINDIYWFKKSTINPSSICGLEFVDYDADSSRTISNLAIKRYKIVFNPLRLIKLMLSIKLRGDPRVPAVPSVSFCFKTIEMIFRLFPLIFLWNKDSWIRYQEINYRCKVLFWESIYRQLGIRMLWTMHDIDSDKLMKAQALERLDGIYMGSHWSNYPLSNIDNQKCYDVIFAWGPHFIRNIFNSYPFMVAFQTGYPLDYYFESKKLNALKLRSKYPGKFILSYQDNVKGKDIIYTKNMQLEIHNMLIGFIKKYDNLIIFLKPKWKDSVDEMKKEIPDIDRYIKEGRIAIFLGDTPRTKAIPAEVGMASDLVVGLGISTTAAECYFAGTVSFHADFTGFTRNEFGNNGLGKIVFRDIKSLEKAVRERITGENNLTHSDYQRYYEMLDPFQDGKTYLRTGFIINRLQDAFRQGFSRLEAVKKVKNEYDVFLSRNYPKKDALDDPRQQASILESA